MKLPIAFILVVTSLLLIFAGCRLGEKAPAKEEHSSSHPASQPTLPALPLPPAAPGERMQGILASIVVASIVTIGLGVAFVAMGFSTPLAPKLGTGLAAGGLTTLLLAIFAPAIYALTWWVTIAAALLLLIALAMATYWLIQHRNLWTAEEVKAEIARAVAPETSGSTGS